MFPWSLDARTFFVPFLIWYNLFCASGTGFLPPTSFSRSYIHSGSFRGTREVDMLNEKHAVFSTAALPYSNHCRPLLCYAKCLQSRATKISSPVAFKHPHIWQHTPICTVYRFVCLYFNFGLWSQVVKSSYNYTVPYNIVFIAHLGTRRLMLSFNFRE